MRALYIRATQLIAKRRTSNATTQIIYRLVLISRTRYPLTSVVSRRTSRALRLVCFVFWKECAVECFLHSCWKKHMYVLLDPALPGPLSCHVNALQAGVYSLQGHQTGLIWHKRLSPVPRLLTYSVF